MSETASAAMSSAVNSRRYAHVVVTPVSSSQGHFDHVVLRSLLPVAVGSPDSALRARRVQGSWWASQTVRSGVVPRPRRYRPAPGAEGSAGSGGAGQVDVPPPVLMVDAIKAMALVAGESARRARLAVHARTAPTRRALRRAGPAPRAGYKGAGHRGRCPC